MLNQKLHKKEIKLFLSESNAKREEKFLRGITDNYENILEWSQTTSTNGNVVKVYPDHPFLENEEAINYACKECNLSSKHFEDNPWLLLKVFSRGGIAHEAAHILFTDFVVIHTMNQKYRGYDRYIFHQIFNIGEDAYIERALINYLGGLSQYIEFSNHIAYYNVASLEAMSFEVEIGESSRINLFLHWAMMDTIVGKVKGNLKDKELIELTNKAKPLFSKMRTEKNCLKRLELAEEIFKLVKSLIDEAKDNNLNEKDFNYMKNEEISYSEDGPINPDISFDKDFESREDSNKSNSKADKSPKVKKDEDNNGNSSNNKSNEEKKEDKSNENNKNNTQKNSENEDFLNKLEDESKNEINTISKEEEKLQKEREKEKVEEDKLEKELEKVQYSHLHSSIKIEVKKKFRPGPANKGFYKATLTDVKGIIKSLTKQLKKLIQNKNDGYENKKVIGSLLDTSRLHDKKGRIWKNKVENKEVSDLNIMLLIDGSGSMNSKLRNVFEATIVLYEVCKELNIPISIVEQRAIYGYDRVEHRVLVGYNNFNKEDTRYNLTYLNAEEGTREGVSLKWVSAYQDTRPEKDKLIIVLSDGEPSHNEYYGDMAINDTKKVAKEISKNRNKNIIAISLEKCCFNNLKKIYPNTILCDELDKLPKQLISILQKNIFR